MQVSEIGEFGLIARLAEAIGAHPPADQVVGIGDDAAVWRAGETYLVATTDTLVEGVHFLSDLVPWTDLGWKALAVNVSDVAAMGAQPLFALVTLALPPTTVVAAVDALYAGLAECGRRFDVTVAGGDIVRAPSLSVTVALIGRAESRNGRPLLLRRDGARPGDVIAVTGTLGDSAAGLRRLRAGTSPADPLVQAHLRPHPPLALGRIAARNGVACGIDISDGLLLDAGHLCTMSGLTAVLRAEAVPMSAALREAYPQEALALACTEGEDYQLLLTAPQAIIEALRAQTNVPITIIGQMSQGEPRVKLLDEAGAEVRFEVAGWDHLAQP